jgi:glycerol kinase
MWMLQNLKNRNMDNLRFGTIDSWFIYRLCGEHLTDYTNASATGIYDIFFDKWSENILKIIGFPEENLPEVKESDSFFGEYRKIPIASVVADQQASLFSLCCFEKGMVKCTNGTGTFVDINVGEEPKASLSGLIPMVGIRLRNLRRYILEGYVSFSGSSIEWIKSLGLLETPEESYRLAEMSEDENLLLVPSFTGLGTPYYTESPGVLWGISNKTSKEDIVKALLESIAFRISEIVSLMDREVSLSIREIRMDGKMSSNDFLLQRVADTTGLKVVRSRYLEGSSFGAHLIAGLSTGEWKLNELKFLGENTFERKKDVTEKFNRWLRLLNETIKKGWI